MVLKAAHKIFPKSETKAYGAAEPACQPCASFWQSLPASCPIYFMLCSFSAYTQIITHGPDHAPALQITSSRASSRASSTLILLLPLNFSVQVITHGPDRASALRALHDALGAVQVAGLPTNLEFMRRITRNAEFQQARTSAHFFLFLLLFFCKLTQHGVPAGTDCLSFLLLCLSLLLPGLPMNASTTPSSSRCGSFSPGFSFVVDFWVANARERNAVPAGAAYLPASFPPAVLCSLSSTSCHTLHHLSTKRYRLRKVQQTPVSSTSRSPHSHTPTHTFSLQSPLL